MAEAGRKEAPWGRCSFAPGTPGKKGKVSELEDRGGRRGGVKGLFSALAFLSILPLPGREEAPERAIGWYPLAGAALGFLSGLPSLLWPGLGAPLGVAALALLTGGLHLDGLADTWDGLARRGSREERLRAMKDPHVGATGVTVLLLVLLLKVEALSGLHPARLPLALALAAAAARWSCLFPMGLFPSARPEGLGHRFHRGLTWGAVLFATLTVSLLVFLAAPRAGMPPAQGGMLLAVSFLTAMGMAFLAHRAFGGLTGDVHGAVLELGETAALVYLGGVL